jgi:hypothetical protein
MDKRKTRFEQVPLAVAKKIAAEEIRRKEASAKAAGSAPPIAGSRLERTVAAGAGVRTL